MKNEDINNDVFIEKLEGLCISDDVSSYFSDAIHSRVSSGITQLEVAKLTGKGLATIQRFEKGKVDSLFLWCFYIERFLDKRFL